MTELRFPYALDGRGRTADRDAAGHVRDLVEQLLFTAPGERVNRPTLGAGLMQLVHEPASQDMAAATQMLVQGALQQWLGTLIEVGDVTVRSDESLFEVTVAYRLRLTGEPRSDVFTRPAP
jgi:hypothetical protein